MYNTNTVSYDGTGDQNEQFGGSQVPQENNTVPYDGIDVQNEQNTVPYEGTGVQGEPEPEQVIEQEQNNPGDQNIQQDTGSEQKDSDDQNPAGWRPGDWRCSSCSDHNFASRMLCRACGASKDGVKQESSALPDNWRPGDWKCSYCGDHQFASRMYCRQCDAPKGAAAPRDSGPPKSGDPNKVYCGNMNTSTTEEALRETMSKYGEVTDCYILGPKGNSKGFGFCEFKDLESAKTAMSAVIELDGATLKVEKSMSRREDNYHGGGGGGGGGWGGPPPRSSESAQKLFIGKIHQDTTNEEFKDYFSKFGDITDSVVMADRGFGFVTFKDSVSTQAALAATLELKGNQLSSERARPKRSEYDDYGPPPRHGGGHERRRSRHDDYYDDPYRRRRGGYDDRYGREHDRYDRRRGGYDDYPPPWSRGPRGPPRGWSPPRRRRW